MIDPASMARSGSDLASSSAPYTGSGGKVVRAIAVIGTADLVIDTMVPTAGQANLSGKTIPKGMVIWTSASGLSITSGECLIFFGRRAAG